MIYNYVLQLLLRTSILLNLSLLLYLSLSAGWTVAGPGDAAAAPHPEPYSRGILNQYFGQCRVTTRHLPARPSCLLLRREISIQRGGGYRHLLSIIIFICRLATFIGLNFRILIFTVRESYLSKQAITVSSGRETIQEENSKISGE